MPTSPFPGTLWAMMENGPMWWGTCLTRFYKHIYNIYMCEEVFSLHCMCKQRLSSFICTQLNPLCQLEGGVQFKFVPGWWISYSLVCPGRERGGVVGHTIDRCISPVYVHDLPPTGVVGIELVKDVVFHMPSWWKTTWLEESSKSLSISVHVLIITNATNKRSRNRHM